MHIARALRLDPIGPIHPLRTSVAPPGAILAFWHPLIMSAAPVAHASAEARVNGDEKERKAMSTYQKPRNNIEYQKRRNKRIAEHNKKLIKKACEDEFEKRRCRFTPRQCKFTLDNVSLVDAEFRKAVKFQEGTIVSPKGDYPEYKSKGGRGPGKLTKGAVFVEPKNAEAGKGQKYILIEEGRIEKEMTIMNENAQKKWIAGPITGPNGQAYSLVKNDNGRMNWVLHSTLSELEVYRRRKKVDRLGFSSSPDRQCKRQKTSDERKSDEKQIKPGYDRSIAALKQWWEEEGKASSRTKNISEIVALGVTGRVLDEEVLDDIRAAVWYKAFFVQTKVHLRNKKPEEQYFRLQDDCFFVREIGGDEQAGWAARVKGFLRDVQGGGGANNKGGGNKRKRTEKVSGPKRQRKTCKQCPNLAFFSGGFCRKCVPEEGKKQPKCCICTIRNAQRHGARCLDCIRGNAELKCIECNKHPRKKKGKLCYECWCKKGRTNTEADGRINSS